MGIKRWIAVLWFGAVLAAPALAADVINIKVHAEVANVGYIGNGVEWDPYDEAMDWGAEISEADWQTLFKRLDFMKPQYVRCMINGQFSYYNMENKTYDRHRRQTNIHRLLDYCTKRHITVIFGEYNPPLWSMKTDQEWIEMSVDYLNWLVQDQGFTCIKHFVIFNEPDGYWSPMDGNYDEWLSVLRRFHQQMSTYPGLLDKVSLAGPDVVLNYKNDKSPYDANGWVEQTAKDADRMIGVYDVHAYPGQYEVRMGNYGKVLQDIRRRVPANKKVVLGEAGYKYYQPEDSVLQREHMRRIEGHPYTKGTDCNMLVYDYFYGLDMPLLAMEAMNNGFSGLALWMLDDAMHSNGDTGKPEDIKIWGLWNILGTEVFNDPSQEEIRPLFYTWSLMCRYFPVGSDILKIEKSSDDTAGVYAVAGSYRGKTTIALLNVSKTDRDVVVQLPQKIKKGKLYLYEEGNLKQDKDGFPLPQLSNISVKQAYKTKLKANTFILLTDIK